MKNELLKLVKKNISKQYIQMYNILEVLEVKKNSVVLMVSCKEGGELEKFFGERPTTFKDGVECHGIFQKVRDLKLDLLLK